MLPHGFFPADVQYFFSGEKFDRQALSDNEWQQAKSYGAKRLTDFCTGRYCLRRCTEPLGFSGDILIGERGKPMLPGHIAASLSHSKTLCGAIAGDKNRYLSMGLDIETFGRVHGELWYMLFTKRETDFLHSLNKEDQPRAATIFFSLKEAFYKLQYPLTSVFLDFPQVEVEVVNGNYHVRLLQHVNDMFAENILVPGMVTHVDDQIITYCVLPA